MTIQSYFLLARAIAFFVLFGIVALPGSAQAQGPNPPRAPRWNDNQSADLVLGQANFTSNSPGTTSTTLWFPGKAVIDPTTNKVFVVDATNNRVLRYASWSALANGAAAERVFGQPNMNSGGPACTASGFDGPTGIALDNSGRLWVPNYNQNRILRFDNASAANTDGVAANGVLGQTNFTSCDVPGLDDSDTIVAPNDLHVDAAGRLWVADTGAGRVMRFDNAAAKANGASADGVLGKPDFTTNGGTPSQNNINYPYALTVDGSGNLFVAESIFNRVLRFNNAAAKANGANADAVIGQTNFSDFGSGLTASTLNSPQGVTTDQYGRLYVADGGNHRVLIFNNAATLGNGAAASNVMGQPDMTSGTVNNGGLSASSLNNPQQLFWDTVGKRLWLADGGNNRVLRFTETNGPSAVTLSSFNANAPAFDLVAWFKQMLGLGQ